MTTLSALASDCIGHLLEYLSANDFHALLSTGDRFLRHKVVGNVRRLKLRARVGEKFPFSAFRLPHLRSLSVGSVQDGPLQYFDEKTKSKRAKEPRNWRIDFKSAGLSSLSLDFANAQSLVTQCYGATLTERFPSLNTLYLRGYFPPELVQNFSNFPQTLTSLSLISRGPYLQKLNLSEVSRLSRSLLSLHLSWHAIDSGNIPKSDLKNILPPKLTSLTLSSLNRRNILFYLPSSLESIDITINEYDDIDGERQEVKTSFLPPKLTSLKLNLDLEFDCALPMTLTTIDINSNTLETILTLDQGNLLWKGLSLPPGLQIRDIWPADGNEECYRIFKRVENVDISEESQLELIKATQNENFPKCLASQKPGLRLLNPLPKGIKSITLYDIEHPDDLLMLPEKLEEFTAYVSGDRFDLPIWTKQHIAMLPKYLRRLHLDLKVVVKGMKLAPISDLFLEILELVSVPLKLFTKASKWLPACLPFHLKTLDIAAPYMRSENGKEISPACIAICRLDEVVPFLETLRLGIPFRNQNPFADLFASLPRNLECLSLHQLDDLYEVGALASLPKSLESLSISFIESDAIPLSRILTNEHLFGLPENLGMLHVFLPRMQHLSRHLATYLPRTLCYVEFYSRETNESELTNAIRRNLDSRDYFRYSDYE